MKAMVLAAGLGTRMRPLTHSLPKPAIPVLGRPLILEILHRLSVSGVEDATVNLHHQGDRIRSLLEESRGPRSPRLTFSPEDPILGTAGGVRKALPSLRGAGFILVQNSDFLANIDIHAAIAAHLESGHAVTLVVAPARDGYTPVDVDAHGTVLSIGGKPPVGPGGIAESRLFTGCQILDEDLVETIPEGRTLDLVRDVYRPLVLERRIGTFLHDGFWWEFGSPHDYLEGCLKLVDLSEEERGSILVADPVQEIRGAKVSVGPGVQLHHGVDLAGRISLGFASFIAEGCSLEDLAIMHETWVGPGCRLRRVVVGPGTEVPAGFQAEEALLCADPDALAPPPPGCARCGGMLLRPLRP